MKAAQIQSYGGEEVVEVKNDVERPTPQANEILVEVRSAGVNPFDWKVREGYMKDFIPISLPATLGGDVAGVVKEVGTEVEDFKEGQQVFGLANAAGGKGSFAEFTTVTANQLAQKPTNIDFNAAAALPLAGVSAYQALVDHMKLQAGQKILIHGGAGGIGSLAIQIAKQIGTQIATTVVKSDFDYVSSLGATTVIDYSQQDFSEVVHEYDAVFDTVGGDTNKKSYQVLKKGGVLVSMVEPIDDNRALQGQINYIHQSTKATQTRLKAITTLVENGAVEVQIDKVFSLDSAAEALEYLKSGHPHGKVVIQVN